MKRQRKLWALLLMMVLAMGICFALPALGDAAPETPEMAQAGAGEAAADDAAATTETVEEDIYDIDVMDGLKAIAESTGVANGNWRQYVMILVSFVLLYLAIVKKFEPLLLLPIGFGMLLANLPLANMMAGENYGEFPLSQAAEAATLAAEKTKTAVRALNAAGEQVYRVETANGGLLYYLYKGVKLGIYPPLIFMGVGAMTDVAPLIANPRACCWALRPSWASSSPSSAPLCWDSRHKRRVPSASSAARTALPPSSSPPGWRPICWAPSRWRRTATWPWCPSSSPPSCGP